jgi:hypothetical protein
MPYPNPFNPRLYNELRVAFNIAQKDSDRISLRIYTAAYRRVLEVVYEGAEAQDAANRGYLQCATRKIARLANGSYYYLVISEKEGKETRSRINTLVILK